METRICNLCGRELPLTNEYFAYRNKTEGKYRERCKECQKEYSRKRWISIKEECGERLEKRHEINAKYYQAHKDEIRARQRETQRKHYLANREDLLEKKREYRKTERGKEANRKYVSQYQYKHWHNDPRYHAIAQVRNALNKSFKRCGEIKSKRNIELTGMTSRELYEYLLETFKQNYGYEWDHIEPVHIDHIIPLSTAKDKAEIESLCHYTNLQLLKADDNWAKHDRLDYEIKVKRSAEEIAKRYADVLPDDA